MKTLFSLSAITFLSVISAFADPQILIHSTHAEEDARAAAQERMQEAKFEGEWFRSLANRALVPADPTTRGHYYDWLRENSQINAEVERRTAVQGLVKGDPIALSPTYDDQATIRIYLHDCGYNDLSDDQISQVEAYMHSNGIRHISELGL